MSTKLVNLRHTLALNFLTEIETLVHQHFRQEALALVTSRSSCYFVRGTVRWVRNNYTWKHLSLSQRLRVRIPMSMISRQGTFQAMMKQVDNASQHLSTNASGKYPRAWYNLQSVKNAIEQEAYRELGTKLCARIRHYFTDRKAFFDLTFWDQLSQLEQSAYEGDVSAKLYREAFTMRLIRLVDIAKEQLDVDFDGSFKVGSN